MSTQIPYGRQWIDQSDIDAVVKVLQGDYLTQGPTVAKFEEQLAAAINAKHVIAVSNGTAALHVAHLAVGTTAGHAVFVPAITFAATANAALYCGATPVFVDINPHTLNMCTDSLIEGIRLAKQNGLKPHVISPVHFAGRPNEMQRIFQIAENENMTIIEDACHALGAEHRLNTSSAFSPIGTSLGGKSIKVYSFHPVKHIATGEGGAISTDDAELAHRMRMLRSHGITKDPSQYQNKKLAFDEQTNTVNPWYHEMQMLGYNYRMCDIQAALGISQLTKLRSFVERRREIAAQYYKKLSDIPHVQLPPGDSDLVRHSYHLFPIRINFENLGKSRAKLMSELAESGIGTQVHYIPVHWHPFYQANRHLWLATSTDAAAKEYASIVSIPMFSKLSDAQALDVVSFLKRLTGQSITHSHNKAGDSQ